MRRCEFIRTRFTVFGLEQCADKSAPTRMKIVTCYRSPHPPFGHPLPEGEGIGLEQGINKRRNYRALT
jgi:hypothetical protein